MRKTIKVIPVILISLILISINLPGQNKKITPLKKAENEACFKCHGQSKYFYFNPDQNRMIKDKMCPDRVIRQDQFYVSNHKSFRCIDCHSEEYDSFPHPTNLRMEPKYTCMDCHGGDPVYASFNFERIEEEYNASIHSEKHSEDFTCWMCHDPHTYKISARNTKNLSEIIAYDNAICLSCHANVDKYQLLTDQENPNILLKHEWLPNQANHWKKVRCIECHAEVQKDILVGHKIKPKSEAVRDCVKCHSQNSLLLESLYRHEMKEKVNKYGFFNARMLTESYLIGANRNYFLNVLSIVIFGMALLAIIIHASLRIAKRTK